MVVLMTDGRANIPSRLSGQVDRMNQDEINEELRRIGRVMRSEAIESVVIDTKSRFVSSGEARNLAEMLGGKYLYLPRAGATGIHEAIESVASKHARQSYMLSDDGENLLQKKNATGGCSIFTSKCWSLSSG